MLVNGREVDMEMARLLRESAKGALDNRALNFVWEQVRYQAITLGVHQNTTPEQGLFAKAALWLEEEVRKNLHTLAQE